MKQTDNRNNVCLQFVTYAGARSPVLHLNSCGLEVLGEVLEYGQSYMVQGLFTIDDPGVVMLHFLHWLSTEVGTGAPDATLQDSGRINGTHWLAYVTRLGVVRLEMMAIEEVP